MPGVGCPRGEHTHTPYVRLGEVAETKNIYLDLGNDSWNAVEVTRNGWEIITNPPVKFRRPGGLRPLPTPTRGGKGLDAFRELFNINDDDQWRLLCGWLLMTLSPQGPYPILIVNGEAGTAKTTICEALRRLIDPSKANLTAVPKEDRDIAIAAHNSWVVAYDNLSHIKEGLSDILCRVATGNGFRIRGLYTDDDEVLFAAERPQVINGIGELARRDNLLSRAVLVRMEQPQRYLTRKELWQQFDAIQGDILGQLLDAASYALGNFAELADMPRMADFAAWVSAAEPQLGWPQGSFLAAFHQNLNQGRDLVLEQSTVALPLIELAKAAGQGGWKGTATELLTALQSTAAAVSARGRGAPDMPKTPAQLGTALSRLRAPLKQAGVIISNRKLGGSEGGGRMLTVAYQE